MAASTDNSLKHAPHYRVYEVFIPNFTFMTLKVRENMEKDNSLCV